MEMRWTGVVAVCGALALGSLGCSRVSKDNSTVLATVRTWMRDDAKASELLTSPGMKEQRNQMLGSLVNQKAMILFAKDQGMDKDARIQIQLTSAIAGTYFQNMIDRLVPAGDPTEEQLKAFYDDYLAQAKASGQAASVPPYEQVKAQ